MNKTLLIVIACVVVGVVFYFCTRGEAQEYPEYLYPEQVEIYEEPIIINGDVNADGRICMDDSIQIIYHLWRDGRDLPCRNAADVDRNGSININDVLWGLQHIFFGAYINDCPVTCDGETQPD